MSNSNDFHQLELAYRSAIEISQFKAGFLARTSHELRSPLNGLISGLQLILSDLCDDPQEEREYLQIAHDSALKLVSLIDQVIMVSRVVQGSYPFKLEVVDLDLALQEVAMLVQMQAQNRNLKLDIPWLEMPVNVIADMNCLRQALVMLIDSAISVMDEGAIDVTVRIHEQAAWIDIIADRPVEAWCESRAVGEAVLPDFALPDAGTLPSLSPNFRLTLAQDLIAAIQGELVLIEVDGKTQLQCRLPLGNLA
jgi:signal transduction histidine kinase